VGNPARSLNSSNDVEGESQMDLDAARDLKPGDPLIAVNGGLSGGVEYYAGQCGVVLYKDYSTSPFFCVELDTGEVTGHVLVENWEPV